VPVPRRFDRRPPDRDPTRINERIRVPKVRLIGADGQQVGVVDTDEARRIAREADLDLVEVAADSRPPVCKVLDYSKYKYELEQKAKAARKHQQQVNIREIKLRPKIADHDYETKKGHVARFLRKKDKVKVTIMFRGREQAHPERGRALLYRLHEDLGELAVIEQNPQQEGRNMHMVLAPGKEVAAEQASAAAAAAEKPASGEKPSAAERASAAEKAETAEKAAAAKKPAPTEKPVRPPTEKPVRPPAEAPAEPAAEAEASAEAPEPAVKDADSA
jgi:translation initiation factor IF-3